MPHNAMAACYRHREFAFVVSEIRRKFSFCIGGLFVCLHYGLWFRRFSLFNFDSLLNFFLGCFYCFLRCLCIGGSFVCLFFSCFFRLGIFSSFCFCLRISFCLQLGFLSGFQFGKFAFLFYSGNFSFTGCFLCFAFCFFCFTFRFGYFLLY